MSSRNPKITSKNLHYDTSLPLFLARLRGEHLSSSSDGPDPVLAAQRRPRGRLRSGSEEAEDAPLVVDEAGVAVAGFSVAADGSVAMERKEDGEGGEEEEEEDARDQQHLVRDNGEGRGLADGDGGGDRKTAADGGAGGGIGGGGGAGGRKRKMGKVVGGGEDGYDKLDRKNQQPKPSDKSNAGGPTKREASDGPGHKGDRTAGKGRKKAKKIKLSFGDDEG